MKVEKKRDKRKEMKNNWMIREGEGENRGKGRKETEHEKERI
jgi:hypothetical protein